MNTSISQNRILNPGRTVFRRAERDRSPVAAHGPSDTSKISHAANPSGPLRAGMARAPLALAMCGLLACAGHSPAQTQPALQSPSEIKKLSLEQLMDIEVTTVSRTDSTVGQSPAAIFVITQEMIRRSGVTTIPELFRMVPGMDVARIDGNKWAIGSRGFNQRFQDKLLVLVDGRTVYNPVFSGVYWDTVDYPLEDIERIEVIRGPGASVWGANAVNGIINIITKPAKDTQGGLASGGGGTEERGFGTFRYGGKISSNLFYRVYGKGFNRAEQFSATGDPHDGWWAASGGARLDWQAGERDAVMFEGGFFHDVAGRRDLRPTTNAASVVSQSGILFTNIFLNIENELTDGGHVLGRWSHTVDQDSSWTLQAYWDRVSRHLDNLDFVLDWDTYDVDFQHQFPLGDRQKIVYGAGYRLVDSFTSDSRRDNGFVVTWDPNRRLTQTFSLFAQDQIAIVPDKFSVTLGTKVEHNDFTGFEVQPTGRLLWTPTKRQTVWAAVSRAVRTPNLLDQFLLLTVPPVAISPPTFPRISGSRDLDSEAVVAYELGYRAQATDNVSVDAALFYNVYDHLIGARPGAPVPQPDGTVIVPLNRENTLHGETYGVELAANWRVNDWWRLYAAYTWLEIQLHRASGLSPAAEAAEGQSPQQQVYLQSSWDLPGHVELDLIGRFVDELSGFNPGGAPGVPNSIGGYISLDARLAWRPRKNLELAIVGQNLLDNHHPEFGTSPQVRSPVVELQRGVYAKVTVWW